VADRIVDVKIVAATKADLEALVAAGSFRSDLYHRLAVVVVELPPLRERAGDVLLLAQQFLRRSAESHGVHPREMAPSALAWLERHSWPGNVRELEHIMERVTLQATVDVVDAATLDRLVLGAVKGVTGRGSTDEATGIREALRETGGNVLAAARLLRLSRNALRYRMRQYAIDPKPGATRPPQATDRSGAGTPPTPAVPAPSVLPAVLPVVGRDRELDQLHQWLGEARAGRRQIVFVSGEPGIGKTTLVEDFGRSVAGDPEIVVAQGRCVDQYGAGEPYLPFLEALERLVGQGSHSDFTEALRRCAPMWAAQVPGAYDPRRGDGRGLQDATQARMLRELARWVEAVTRDRVLVLWLEDLHWSDASTLVLLSLLAGRPEPARFLLIGTFRPVATGDGAPPLAGVRQELLLHGRAQELALGFLRETAIADYLRARLGHRPGVVELARALHARTEGNPLFAVSVLDDVLRDSLTDMALAADAVRAGLPRNVGQFISHQFQRLNGRAQQVLGAGSVCGMEFAAAAVAAAVGESVSEVEAVCTELVRQGIFLEDRGVAQWADGTVGQRFGFVHALYQEILYAQLPAGRQSEIHLAVGDRLERSAGGRGGDLVAELALHFDRGGDRPRAVRYLHLAGRNALRRYAHREAIAYTSRALAELQALPETPDNLGTRVLTHTTLGQAWMALKGYAAPEVYEHYSQALPLCRRQGETPAVFRVLRGLLAYHTVRAELSTARGLSEELQALAEKLGDPTLIRQAHGDRGVVLCHLGEIEPGQSHLDAAADSVRPDPTVSAYSGWALWYLGYPDRALAKSQEAVQHARGLGDPHTLALTLGFATCVRKCRREVGLVLELADAGAAHCREQQYPYWLAGALMHRGWALAEEGHHAEGLAELKEGMAAYLETGTEVGLPHFQVLYAEALALTGERLEALRVLDESIELMEHNHNRWHEAEVYRVKGEILAGFENREDEARAALGRALEVARRQRALWPELRAATALARLAEGLERREALADLSSVCQNISEGTTSPDFQEAAALLRSGP
jgi:predicted ATPase